MLKADPCDGPDAAFAAKHAGDTIAFNGSVAAMAHHGSANTRYDILIAPGDKGTRSTAGPQFQFRDVNLFDLNLTGKVRNTFGENDRARFFAQVDEFDTDSCLFLLRPVETRVR